MTAREAAEGAFCTWERVVVEVGAELHRLDIIKPLVRRRRPGVCAALSGGEAGEQVQVRVIVEV